MFRDAKLFIHRWRKFLEWLWQQNGTPGQLARGLASGVFSGCFPFFGVQTLIGIALARIIKGNVLLAAVGTWISNPITYVPIYWLNYKLGCCFLGHRETIPNLELITLDGFIREGWLFTSRILIGSTFTGSIAALLTFLFAYLILKRKARFRRRN